MNLKQIKTKMKKMDVKIKKLKMIYSQLSSDGRISYHNMINKLENNQKKYDSELTHIILQQAAVRGNLEIKRLLK